LTQHYALTNQKEFFAEMTEAYFGVNDFYPFNRAELKQAEPALFEQMGRWWTTPATAATGAAIVGIQIVAAAAGARWRERERQWRGRR
jgi:hypothetical protein